MQTLLKRENRIRKTPLVPLRHPRAEGRVWLKCEQLQVTGSFKVRGAWRALSALSAEERERGVVASAGNHGGGVAWSGGVLKIPVTVVVPTATPRVKLEQIERLGGRVIVQGDTYDQADAFARSLALKTSQVFISPFDDDQVIKGNGLDLGQEIWQQCPTVTQVVAPVGGGGMLAGVAMALAPRGVRVIGVSPENNCAMVTSLQSGRAQTVYEGKLTIAEGCDGAVSERTFVLCRDGGCHVTLVSEAAISQAVAFAYREQAAIIEATGAVALAGWLEGRVPSQDNDTTVIVLSGGNIDPATLQQFLAM